MQSALGLGIHHTTAVGDAELIVKLVRGGVGWVGVGGQVGWDGGVPGGVGFEWDGVGVGWVGVGGQVGWGWGGGRVGWGWAWLGWGLGGMGVCIGGVGARRDWVGHGWGELGWGGLRMRWGQMYV